MENSQIYVDGALKDGYDVEVDIWAVNGKFIMHHDDPEAGQFTWYLKEPSLNWLKQDGLWIHAKNQEAFDILSKECNRVFQLDDDSEDDFTRTTDNILWLGPKNSAAVKGCILVNPEASIWTVGDFNVANGICSDYISKYDHYARR